MTDDMQREDFERWCNNHGYSTYTDGEHYAIDETHAAWGAWCAAIRHMREQEDKA